MKIAVDAMGGDYAPLEIVFGAVRAAKKYDCEIVLVGDEPAIRKVLEHEPDWEKLGISIVHASQVIGMDEHPADAVRTKKDASVVVATRLVKDGICDAVLSAGSTGAAVTAAQLILRRIKGIGRPTIATPMPTPKGVTLLLDSGANVDSKPVHLVQSGLMGSLYAQYVFGVKEPRVGLLNIGEEETKGNEQAKATYQLLKNMHTIRFAGNAEGRDVPKGNFDVVICDGFVGNVVLKFAEGLAKTILKLHQGGREERRLAREAWRAPPDADAQKARQAARCDGVRRGAAPRRQWLRHHQPWILQCQVDLQRDRRGR